MTPVRQQRKSVNINILHVIFVVVLLAAGGWAAWKWLKPVDDRDLITGRLDEIRASVAKEGKEGIAVTAAQSKALSKIAWESINVELSEFRFRDTLDRDEIVKLFSIVRQQINTLHISFYDLTITLDGADAASVKGTLVITVTGGAEAGEETCDVMMRWLKSPDDGQWYITDVTIRPVLGHNFNK